MKHKPTPLSTGKNMMITEDYRCKYCRSKVPHWNRGTHMLVHTEKLFPIIYTPMRNK